VSKHTTSTRKTPDAKLAWLSQKANFFDSGAVVRVLSSPNAGTLKICQPMCKLLISGKKRSASRLTSAFGFCTAGLLSVPALAQPQVSQSGDASGASTASSSTASLKPADDDSARTALHPGLFPPKLLHFEQAVYPPEAQNLELDASVVLQISIDNEGKVVRVEVRDPAGHGFDEAAARAAEKFTFEPATRDGKPVAAKILYRYGFKLEPKPVQQSSSPAASAIGQLRGKIVAGSPPTGLAGVSLSLTAVGFAPVRLVTAADGTWVAAPLAPGQYNVEVAAAGYQRITQRERVDADRVTAVTYALESSEETAIEVTVRGTAIHREVAHYELSRKEMMRVPGTFGDAIHAVEAMPSVARPPAFSGALIVRGSAPRDTQVFVDGTLVPRVFHYGSLSSVVPTEMVERLEFYPSNFSARYGRGMGGVVEVGLRQTNPDGKYHGSVQVDFINARANAEGPVPGLKGWSFMGGMRTSYVDRWLVPVLRSSGSALAGMPRYYDYQTYLERRLPNNGVFRIGVFGSHDMYVPIDQNTTDWRPPSDSFGHLQSQLRLPLSSLLDFRASWSLGRNQSTEPGENDRMLQTKFTLGTFRSELALKTGSVGIARLGTDMLYAPFTVRALTDSSVSNGELASTRTNSPSLTSYDIHGVYLRPAVYAEYELAPTRRINITAGTRFDYTKDTSKFDVAPRVAARYVLVDGATSTVLKGGFGLFYQPPEPGQTLPELGTTGLKSNRAVHSMLGFEQSLSKQVTLSVEAFDKEMRQLVVSRTDGTGNVTTENSGKGRVVGTDLLLRYRADERFFGWIAYTLSRSTRQTAPDQPEQLFIYDQTHVLNVLASYKLGRGWELGGRFRYMSGPLYRACQGGLFDNATGGYSCYGSPNQARLGPYHQLDVRVEKTWEFSRFRISGYLDLLNAYNHSSPDFATMKFDRSEMKPQSLSLPILPSFGIRGEI